MNEKEKESAIRENNSATKKAGHNPVMQNENTEEMDTVRMVQPVTQPEAREEREQNAIFAAAIAGLEQEELPPETQQMLQQYVNGEIEYEALLAHVMEIYLGPGGAQLLNTREVELFQEGGLLWEKMRGENSLGNEKQNKEKQK